MTPAEPYTLLLSILDGLTDQDVLVIASGPMSQSSFFGGLLATAATASGAHGVVVDGHVRDAQEIREIGLPTFARGFSPLDSCGRDEVVAIDEPVVVDGVPVCRGDLVFADADGLVAVPTALCDEVVGRAMAKVHGEGTCGPPCARACQPPRHSPPLGSSDRGLRRRRACSASAHSR